MNQTDLIVARIERARQGRGISVAEFARRRSARIGKRLWYILNGQRSMHVDEFNAQCPQITVRHTRTFHDRFLILDSATAYHIGASLKDAGKKCFGIDLIQDEELTKALIEKLKSLDERQTA